MTVKELAAFTGKDERTIQRWIKKASDKMSSVADKMSSAGHGKVVNYDIDEVEAILNCSSLGSNAVLICMANARKESKNKIVSSSNDDLIVKSFAMMTDAFNKIADTQSRLAGRVEALEQKEENKDSRLKLPAPQKKPRDEFNQLVRKLAYDKNMSVQDAYHFVYAEMLYRDMGNIELCAKNRGIKPVQYLDDMDLFDSAIAIVIELLG